ncbi:hypothetical protein [Pseudomonas sp. NFX98]|uniref:hypothetical protein n=1 Tax=Pseudomonas sp. NFX98 TaxID=3399122 RepID=UPI0039FD759A
MIQIALLLFGAEFVRTKAKFIALMGLLWSLRSAGVLIDLLIGATRTERFCFVSTTITPWNVSGARTAAMKATT